MTDQNSFILIGADRPSRYVILCDHASNRVPPEIANGDLGLSQKDMERHIAYDVGAAGVSKRLGEVLDAPVLLSQFSRLVIDPNRSEDDPTLIMQLYDGSVIPANRGLDNEASKFRIETYHRPYRKAAEALAASRDDPILIAVHSFTPRLKGRPPRPWEIGVLFSHDRRYSDPLIKTLKTRTKYTVGENQPYNGALDGDTMDEIALRQNRLHTLLEIRNDLITTKEDQIAWGNEIASHLEVTTAGL